MLHRQNQYLNNRIEQDHRPLKQRYYPMLGFGRFDSIFIGGQILDRGVTVGNLIGFFYGRRPQVFQQDTVLQHSRMFGFRPLQDLTVTRFYTERQIYDAMRRMHESDVALRDQVTSNPDEPVVFIQRDPLDGVVPCSPNKILASSTITLRPFKRILPVGFQTDATGRTKSVVKSIDQTLKELAPVDSEAPFQITLEEAKELLRLVHPTKLMEKRDGYDFDWDGASRSLFRGGARSCQPRSARGCLLDF